MSFFETPWAEPVAALSAADQSWVLSCAGFTLRALGLLADARTPIRAGGERRVESKDWENAAISYSNISGLEFALGNLAEAITAARLAVDFADRSGDLDQRVARRANLAGNLHQSGSLAEAARLFEEAERLQAERQSEYPILSSVPGSRYCDLLLDQGQTTKVFDRASRTLDWAKRRGDLNDIGLGHLSLGRAHPTSAEAAHHLDLIARYSRASLWSLNR